jgi:iron complex transport system permease protein
MHRSSLTPTQLQAIAATLLFVALVTAITQGTLAIPAAEALRALLPGSSDVDAQHQLIVLQLRLPRTLLAALLGAILATSGAITQGLFRNPLADPSLIGVTAGASLGASIAILLAASWSGAYGLALISTGAFIGGLSATLVVYRLATSNNNTSVATMLLAGIAITALVSAVSNILEFHSSNELLRRISLWRMGGLEGATAIHVGLAAAVALLLLLTQPLYTQALNAMLLGESQARYLGVDVAAVKARLIVIVAIAVGCSVALGGTIAFIGLVVPHIARLLIGPDHRHLIPLSAWLGASLLVFADTVARVVIAPAELPVGVVTAIIGVPFFISLLRQRRQQEAL